MRRAFSTRQRRSDVEPVYSLPLCNIKTGYKVIPCRSLPSYARCSALPTLLFRYASPLSVIPISNPSYSGLLCSTMKVVRLTSASSARKTATAHLYNARRHRGRREAVGDPHAEACRGATACEWHTVTLLTYLMRAGHITFIARSEVVYFQFPQGFRARVILSRRPRLCACLSVCQPAHWQLGWVKRRVKRRIRWLGSSSPRRGVSYPSGMNGSSTPHAEEKLTVLR